MPVCVRCGSPRIHQVQDYPHGEIYLHCRNCNAYMLRNPEPLDVS